MITRNNPFLVYKMRSSLRRLYAKVPRRRLETGLLVSQPSAGAVRANAHAGNERMVFVQPYMTASPSTGERRCRCNNQTNNTHIQRTHVLRSPTLPESAVDEGELPELLLLVFVLLVIEGPEKLAHLLRRLEDTDTDTDTDADKRRYGGRDEG